jgi:hypothetical protein
MTKIKFAIIALFVSFSSILPAQVISQLGAWNNNANFVIKYHQGRVVTSTTSGIIFLDVSNPNNPVPSASLGNPANFPMAIEIKDNYAYFGGGMTGYFMIADISNLNFPFQTGITYDIGGTGYQIGISGDYAFMPTNMDTLYSIDISDKTSPVVVDKINLGSFSSGIAVKGNYAFVGTSGGLKVIDISDPLNMSIITSFGSVYGNISADTLNNRLFVSKIFGFDVIDISNPINPVGLFQGIGGDSGGDLIYLNGYVFQVGNNNVSAFQIEPSSATYLASFTSTMVNAVSAKDSIFYLSTVNDFYVLKLSYEVTGIESFAKPESFAIYPNPANNFITIKNENISTQSTVTIYNCVGKLLKRIDYSASKTVKIDISEFKNGTYFIRILNNNIVKQIKFIKE